MIDTNQEDAWLKKWVLIGGILLVTGIFVPVLMPAGGNFQVIWVWDGFAEWPWAITVLVLLLLALSFLPLLLRQRLNERALATAVLVFSIASFATSGNQFALFLGQGTSWMTGTSPLMGLILSAVLVTTIPLTLFLIGMGVSNHLSATLPQHRFPYLYLRFTSGLFLAIFTLLMSTSVGSGATIFTELFLSPRIWADGWFILLSLLLLLLFSISCFLHSYLENMAGFISVLLKILLISIPLLMLFGPLLTRFGAFINPGIVPELFLSIVTGFIKIVCLLYGPALLMSASLSSTVKFGVR